MILHYSTEVSIHVSDNLEDVLSQIGMNANDIALAKVKYYVLHTQMISILLYLTAKPLLHASQPDKIIGTTRSTPEGPQKLLVSGVFSCPETIFKISFKFIAMTF